MAVLFADLLFILLPLIILALMFGLRGKLLQLLSSPEWSFVAAILCGQALVRFVSGIMADFKFQEQRVTMFVALLVVLGIMPSIVVLVLVLSEVVAQEPSASPLPLGLTYAQLISFVIAVVAFVVLGGTGELNRMKKHANTPQKGP